MSGVVLRPLAPLVPGPAGMRGRARPPSYKPQSASPPGRKRDPFKKSISQRNSGWTYDTCPAYPVSFLRGQQLATRCTTISGRSRPPLTVSSVRGRFRTVEPGDVGESGQRVDCEVVLSPQQSFTRVYTAVGPLDAEWIVVGAAMRYLVDGMQTLIALRVFLCPARRRAARTSPSLSELWAGPCPRIPGRRRMRRFSDEPCVERRFAGPARARRALRR